MGTDTIREIQEWIRNNLEKSEVLSGLTTDNLCWYFRIRNNVVGAGHGHNETPFLKGYYSEAEIKDALQNEGFRLKNRMIYADFTKFRINQGCEDVEIGSKLQYKHSLVTDGDEDAVQGFNQCQHNFCTSKGYADYKVELRWDEDCIQIPVCSDHAGYLLGNFKTLFPTLQSDIYHRTHQASRLECNCGLYCENQIATGYPIHKVNLGYCNVFICDYHWSDCDVGIKLERLIQETLKKSK